MPALSNKSVIVTGASSGIGYATARLFASEGARLVAAGRNQAALDRLVTEIRADGGEAVARTGDVRDEDFARSLVATAVETYGGLDVAFNNAGSSGALGETIGIALDAWDETIATNLTSAFLGAKYQIPAMLERGGGSLIFTASFVGYTVGFPGMAAYAAAKAGVLGLTKALAAELGPQGIRVNALAPGGTDTPGFHATNGSDEQQVFVRSLHGLKRIAGADEIARSALYLASDASSFMTGATLLVDGGISINRT
jgi:NAD(P)-dependent dehydrogenase (short-subunit alcohol dehydrogenase family)